MVKEDNSLDLILLKESKDFDKIIESSVRYRSDPRRLLGKNLTDSQIECYLDNIAISTYNRIVRENESLMRLYKNGIAGPEFNKNFENYIDKELEYGIKENLDMVVIHELTHRITRYSHPSNPKNLSSLVSIMSEFIKKGDVSNSKRISMRGYDNQDAKNALLKGYNRQTYTTEDFNNAIYKAISWYTDRYI